MYPLHLKCIVKETFSDCLLYFLKGLKILKKAQYEIVIVSVLESAKC